MELPVISDVSNQPSSPRSPGLEPPPDEFDRDDCAAYLAFFLAGPKRYRKAFQGYLADLGSKGDWPEAARAHLLSLDQGAMLDAATKYVHERLKRGDR